jgi:hypothetical protein
MIDNRHPDDIQMEKDSIKMAKNEGPDFCNQFDANAILKQLICEYSDSDADDFLFSLREVFWGNDLGGRKITGKLHKYLKK